ncbi:unnamed protein product [Amoebophrya sp. A120]|nr:unnamed protein product [Amoebophrya sp. A120]|eukprot:GSA120T00022851001.1
MAEMNEDLVPSHLSAHYSRSSSSSFVPCRLASTQGGAFIMPTTVFTAPSNHQSNMRSTTSAGQRDFCQRGIVTKSIEIVLSQHTSDEICQSNRPSRGRRRRRTTARRPLAATTALVAAVSYQGGTFFQAASAFDRDGHEAIGMTAMSAIERGKVLTTMKKLLKGKDIMDISGWAHAVDEKFTWAQQMHYQTYKLGGQETDPYEQQCENLSLLDDEAHCPGKMCLLPAMKHFYANIVKAKNVPAAPAISFPGGHTFTDADGMKFLVNLLGDVHQPLHFLPSNGPLGSDAPVKKKQDLPCFQKQVSSFAGKGSFYELWDKDMTQTIRTRNPMWWDGGWTNIHRGRGFGVNFDAQALYEKENQDFIKKNKEKLESAKKSTTDAGEIANLQANENAKIAFEFLEKWTRDAAVYACKNVYRDPVAKRMIDEGYTIPEHDFEIWKHNMLERMLTAGARTAILVNAIVEGYVDKPATHENFSSGTALRDVVDPEDAEIFDDDVKTGGSRARLSPEIAFRNCMINLCLFLLQLAGLVAFLKYTSPPAHLGTYNVTLSDSEGGKNSKNSVEMAQTGKRKE